LRADPISASTLSASAATGTSAAGRVHVVGQVGRDAEGEGQRAARGLQIAFGRLKVELRLARGRPRLQHVRDGREAHAAALFGGLQVGLGLGQGRVLRLEQRARGEILEVGDLDLEHDS
jgi:hypothetical protein